MTPEIPTTQQINAHRKEESVSLSAMGPIVAGAHAAFLYCLRVDPESCRDFRDRMENDYKNSNRKTKIEVIRSLGQVWRNVSGMLYPQNSNTPEERDIQRSELINNLVETKICDFPLVEKVVDLVMGKSHLEIEINNMDIVKDFQPKKNRR